MKTSQRGIDLIKGFEGLRLRVGRVFCFSGIVYVATCSDNGRQYVGQSYRTKDVEPKRLLEGRMQKHYAQARLGSTLPFHNAIRKHGVDAFAWAIAKECSDRDDINATETKEILERSSMVDGSGYNASSGGNERIFCEYTKRRMSESARRRWRDPEKRQKALAVIAEGREKNMAKNSPIWRAGARRTIQSAEVRVKANKSIRIALSKQTYRNYRSRISKAMWDGLSKTERTYRISRLRCNEAHRKASVVAALNTAEYKENASLAIRARLARVFLVENEKTGDRVGYYHNIIEAAEALGVHAANVSACLHGISKTFGFGKYHARFI